MVQLADAVIDCLDAKRRRDGSRSGSSLCVWRARH